MCLRLGVTKTANCLIIHVNICSSYMVMISLKLNLVWCISLIRTYTQLIVWQYNFVFIKYTVKIIVEAIFSRPHCHEVSTIDNLIINTTIKTLLINKAHRNTNVTNLLLCLLEMVTLTSLAGLPCELVYHSNQSRHGLFDSRGLLEQDQRNCSLMFLGSPTELVFISLANYNLRFVQWALSRTYYKVQIIRLRRHSWNYYLIFIDYTEL